jgi:hypothetical protein
MQCVLGMLSLLHASNRTTRARRSRMRPVVQRHQHAKVRQAHRQNGDRRDPTDPEQRSTVAGPRVRDCRLTYCASERSEL